MSVNDSPENVPTTLDGPDAEPLDGRDSQPVPEGSSDDPRTLEADDPLRDPERLMDNGPVTEPLPEDESFIELPDSEELVGTSGSGALPNRDGVDGPLGDETFDEDALPDGSGNDGPPERRPDPDRFDAG